MQHIANVDITNRYFAICHIGLSAHLPALTAKSSMQVGIGAFVVNSKREVLVVQERFGPLKGSVSHTLSYFLHTSASLMPQYQSTMSLAHLAKL